MKYYYLILIITPLFLFGQQKAVTEKGEVVLLFNDGTWKYEDGAVPEESVLNKNPFQFKKPLSSSFNIKSKKNDFSIWYNPKKWTVNQKKFNEDTEYEFIDNSKEVFIMMINEGASIDIKNLRNIVIQNISENSTEYKVISEELRDVNNQELLYLEIKANIKGLKFYYIYHIISNENGCSQIIAYTYENLLSKHKPEIINFLNGTDIQKK